MGKVIGGGLPAAAYGGPRELLERVAPAGDVYQAGTLSGNPLAVAAGLATLRRLDAAAYERLGRAHRPARRRPRPRGRRRHPASSPGSASPRSAGLVTPFFAAAPPHDFDGASACDLDAYGRFCRAMLERGFYPPPSQFEAWFVSLAHDDEAIDRTCEAAADCFREALDVTMTGSPLRPEDALDELASQLRDEGPVVAEPRRRADADPRDRHAGRRRPALRRAIPARTRQWSSWSARATSATTGEPRLLGRLDPDLRLLVGDHLYARGIERLARLGDLLAVAELSDLISLAAQLDAAGRRSRRRARSPGSPRRWRSQPGPAPITRPPRRPCARPARPARSGRWPASAPSGAGLSEHLSVASEAVGFAAPNRG